MLDISRTSLLTIVCGILSGILFAYSVYNADAELLMMFMPAVPLAVIGLSVSARHCFAASAIACLVAGLICGIDAVIAFAVLIVFPLHHLIRKALLWRGDETGEHDWHPILPALAEVTVITTAITVIFCLLTAHAEGGEIRALIAKALDSQLAGPLAEADPKMAYIMRTIFDDWNFAILAFLSWLWVCALYLFAVIANLFLALNGIALRKSLALTPGSLPTWLPCLIVISGGLIFFGNANDHYIGKVALLALLLPYFLSGLASLHTVSSGWGNRRMWLALFYFLLMLFPYIAVFAIAKGLHTQIEELWKSHITPHEH